MKSNAVLGSDVIPELRPRTRTRADPSADARYLNKAPGNIIEPCRRAFSREEMIEEAKAYMLEMWGPCREAEDRDRWHERLGMLVHFIYDRFPSNA